MNSELYLPSPTASRNAPNYMARPAMHCFAARLQAQDVNSEPVNIKGTTGSQRNCDVTMFLHTAFR